MPRLPRRQSSTNIYHAVLRGNDRKTIFFDAEDYERYIEILRQKRKDCDCVIYAWCLMPNHVHLLIKERSKPLGYFFQGIAAAFVFWYNRKYDRVGHLFQGRYRTEPVETPDYFLNVMRYINMNPVKGNICKKPDEYLFSSYRSFFCDGKYADDHMLYDLIRIDELKKFHFENNEDLCLDIDMPGPGHLTDGEVIAIGRQFVESGSFADLKNLPPEKRIPLVNSLLKAGASVEQIDRLSAC